MNKININIKNMHKKQYCNFPAAYLCLGQKN